MKPEVKNFISAVKTALLGKVQTYFAPRFLLKTKPTNPAMYMSRARRTPRTRFKRLLCLQSKPISFHAKLRFSMILIRNQTSGRLTSPWIIPMTVDQIGCSKTIALKTSTASCLDRGADKDRYEPQKKDNSSVGNDSYQDFPYQPDFAGAIPDQRHLTAPF